MEHQLWKAIVALLVEHGKPKKPMETYSDMRILEVYFWAVLHDRPVSWACDKSNWPIFLRRHPLPSSSRMSRRMRSESVLELLETVEKRVARSKETGQLVWYIDGKPLTISGISKDRQAGYGRAAGGKAKGYKLHAVVGADKSLADWKIAPMNVDERKMARRMLKRASIQGYVVADANYDSNPLHEVCDDRNNLQLVAPRRYGKGKGHGHRKQTSGRLRSKEILENPQPDFGDALLKQRCEIERYFGNLSNWSGGLTHLPPWVRTHRRVENWVRAKIITTHLRRQLKQTTYVN